jgi:hypothetical protein
VNGEGTFFDFTTALGEHQGASSLVSPPEFQLQRQVAPPRSEVRSISEIKPLPAIKECGLMPTVVQLEPLRACGERPFALPVLITDQGFLIDGYKRWTIARERNFSELPCIVLPIDCEEALRRVLEHARTRNRLNQFCRIELALKLTDPLRLQAKKNQQAGGKEKLLAKLPEASHIDVRQQTADYAGASEGCVRYVQHVLAQGVMEVRDAARRDEISIYAAFKISKLNRNDQLRELRRMSSNKSQARRLRAQVQHSERAQGNPQALLVDLLSLVKRARSSELPEFPGDLHVHFDRIIEILEKKFDAYSAPATR